MIGQTIRRFRKLKDIRQGELANICNITQSYLSNIEKGRKTPSTPLIFRIAKALAINPAELFQNEESKVSLSDLNNLKNLVIEQIKEDIEKNYVKTLELLIVDLIVKEQNKKLFKAFLIEN